VPYLGNKDNKTHDTSINKPEKGKNCKRKRWETKKNNQKQAKTSPRDDRDNNQPLAKTAKTTFSKTAATHLDYIYHLIWVLLTYRNNQPGWLLRNERMQRSFMMQRPIATWGSEMEHCCEIMSAALRGIRATDLFCSTITVRQENAVRTCRGPRFDPAWKPSFYIHTCWNGGISSAKSPGKPCIWVQNYSELRDLQAGLGMQPQIFLAAFCHSIYALIIAFNRSLEPPWSGSNLRGPAKRGPRSKGVPNSPRHTWRMIIV